MTWIEATILRPLLFSFSRSSPALVSAHQPPANPCLPTCKSPILRPSSALRIPSAQVAIFGLLCSFLHFGVLAFVNLDLLVWISKILIPCWSLWRKCDYAGNFWALQLTRVLFGSKDLWISKKFRFSKLKSNWNFPSCSPIFRWAPPHWCPGFIDGQFLGDKASVFLSSVFLS